MPGYLSTPVLAAATASIIPSGNLSAITVQEAITELELEKSALASPTFTGTPLSTTASVGTNTTQIATTAFVLAEVPAGLISPFAGPNAPPGWLLCFGQTNLNTYTYRRLHAAISNTYGGTAYSAGVTDQPSASTTFTIPDLRGRVVAALDNMGGTDAGRLDWANTIGTAGGAQTHTLAESEIPSHTHNANHAHSGYVGVSGADDNNHTGNGDFVADSDAGYKTNRGVTINANNFNVSNTGGGGAHNNMQPTMLLNYIIKT